MAGINLIVSLVSPIIVGFYRNDGGYVGYSLATTHVIFFNSLLFLSSWTMPHAGGSGMRMQLP